MKNKSAWGSDKTQLFFDLEPETILEAIEAQGWCCTGMCSALNSYENRVYEIQLEASEHEQSYVISKFYRPGRWSEAQLLEEHRFIWDLEDVEIPVISPIKNDAGESLHRCPSTGLFYCLYHKVGGRSVDEIQDNDYERLGRLIARMHEVGAASPAPNRVELTAESYLVANKEYLLNNHCIPLEYESSYATLIDQLIEVAESEIPKAPQHRIHGDCHFGNILWQKEQPYFLDFDDMLTGPAVQDLWLLLPGRDEQAQASLRRMLEGYRSMRDFPYQNLALIEILRAMRFVHFTAWIARRWEDPAFKRAFPYFMENNYWAEQMRSLQEQLALIHGPATWS